MKKFIFTAMALVFVASMAFAVENAAKISKAAAVKPVEMEGIIIDNLCATGNKAKLPEFIKTHTKSCALMPNCAKSGYSLYMPDGSLNPFDKASNVRIEKFLKKKASNLEVSVSVKEQLSGELKLVTIKNSKNAEPANAVSEKKMGK